MKRNRICECGQPAKKNGRCDFCAWCESQIMKGGEVRRRNPWRPKPMVNRGEAWDRMVDFVRHLKISRADYELDTNRRRFDALFRKPASPV